MRIEFLNVWSGKTGKVLAEYLQEEAKMVDVFCFQEADKFFPEMADEILGGSFKKLSAYKYVDDDDLFPQAIYVRNGIEVIDCGTILANTPDTGLGLNCVLLKGIFRVSLANIHGISKPGSKLDTKARLRQSREIIEYFENKDGPVIIGGDFNLEKATESVDLFGKVGYRNLIEEYGIRTTRNGIIWRKYPQTPQYYSDYVFVNPEVKVRRFRVTENEVSDHLPMILEIEE